MLKRWDSITENINLFVVQLVKKLVRKVFPKLETKTRGRPPKHDPEGYLTLLAAKEFDKKSLRGAEVRLSKLVCNERVDHSVIAYWEKKPNELWQLDIKGPFKIENKKYYFVICIDDYSRYLLLAGI